MRRGRYEECSSLVDAGCVLCVEGIDYVCCVVAYRCDGSGSVRREWVIDSGVVFGGSGVAWEMGGEAVVVEEGRDREGDMGCGEGE